MAETTRLSVGLVAHLGQRTVLVVPVLELKTPLPGSSSLGASLLRILTRVITPEERRGTDPVPVTGLWRFLILCGRGGEGWRVSAGSARYGTAAKVASRLARSVIPVRFRLLLLRKRRLIRAA